ncbi:MAG TPA: hypothetical protein VGP79_09575 [Bryobacteraceae bacterium]|nr:hypothetical protein [Bryobacteraceae bacterium]
MITELRSERAAIEQALLVLERLAGSHGKRRGRPPAWLSAAKSGAAGSDSGAKRTVSPEARKRMAAAQKKRWAQARKSQASDKS